MRKIGSIILAIAFIASFVTAGYAQSPPEKLGRGLVNTFTGFWEVPSVMLRMCKSDGAPKGLTIGLGRGIAMGLYRTLVGVYEVLSFAIPAPAGYEPITDPPTLITSETLEPDNPTMRSDFRPLSSEYEGKTQGGSGKRAASTKRERK